MRQGSLRRILTFLLAAVFLFSVFMVIRRQIQYRQIIADSDEAARIAGLEKSAPPRRPEAAPPVPAAEREEPAETEVPPADPLPEEAAELANIDLEALRAVNEDVVGWIAIPGTDLSYPMVQGEDNQYYLSHNWKKESISGGAVFLDAGGGRDLADFRTVIFAHRMRNGTMFGMLKEYQDTGFWREHPRVYLVTDGGVYCYDIFSAQEASVNGIVYRPEAGEGDLAEEYIRYCTEGSVIETGITPEADDRFLVLSTCTGTGYASRWVVHARLAHVYGAETAE